MECGASLAMLNKKKNVIVILHYDLATRNSIDEEWTSLISHFSDGQTSRRRPIFFASENWKHIFSLIVDMYERLTAAASIVSKKTGTTANLWKKTDAFMTDAASKNLEVKKLVLSILNSQQQSCEIPCKSCTMDKLDHSNFSVLSNFGKGVKLWNALESIYQSLNHFFCGKKTIVEPVIAKLLVTYNKSCYLADEIDYAVEQEKKINHMPFYYQRRFLKLRY